MMVGEAHALGGGYRGYLTQPTAEFAPCAVLERGPFRQGPMAVAMYRAADFGEHQHRAAECLEQLEVRTQVLELGARIPLEQLRRVPARDAGEPETRENRFQNEWIARKFVSELHSLESDLARLGEADLERGVAPELAHIIVRPDDGVRPQTNTHLAPASRIWRIPPISQISRISLFRPTLRFGSSIAFACFTYLRTLGDLGHGYIPPVSAGARRGARISLDEEHRGTIRAASLGECAFELRHPGDARGVRAEGARMGHEIDVAPGAVATRPVAHVVEARVAGRALQALDTAKATIVEQHDDQLHSEAHRARHLAVQHEIRPIAHHHDHFALGMRELDAECTRDLVAHAGVAILEVIAAHLLGLPVPMELAGQATGGSDDDVGGLRRALYRADDLRIGGQPFVRCAREGFRGLPPTRTLCPSARGPVRSGPPVTECSAQLTQALARIGDQGKRPVLTGVERLDVERNQPLRRRVEQHR